MTTEQWWAAVIDRDQSADGSFLYGVMTTGVYCRPSCPSRRPLRANVRFFADAPEAELAGLRPCQRCDPRGLSPAARRAELVQRACRFVDEASELPDLETLAAAVGLSRFYFHRVFKAETGITPKAYVDARRAERVRSGLGAGGAVTEAIYDAGFESNGRFYASSNDRLGMTPSQFRAGAPDLEVHFAVAQCSLGSILVAVTARGVCAIELGDDPDVLVRRLQDRFSAACLLGGDAEIEALVAQVVGLVEDPRTGKELPLDVRGTAFQERVWQELRRVPPGSTVTYSQVAKRIGSPAAVRAVAGACAANQLAVAIPCHRVVRTDGSLSGYRWGVERKQTLLEREGSR
ncbi:MAG: 6-O-methylguanine methyltransferase [Acidimicrobiia bacterium]|nr:6-O-methylguanine methyltransferase [Acidimicrobiia bacterium]